VCHIGDQRSTNDKADPIAKSAICFKDDRIISDHELSNKGQLGRVYQ
jgi:hypothetical protein